MREIKFRGKTKQGKWVYGYYLPWHAVKTEDRAEVYAQIFEEEDEKHAKGLVFVKANTIGQYTGLKDKNGVEIYEGDVVKVSDFNFGTKVGKVEWNNEIACFRIVGHLFDHSMGIYGEDIEVIGNIHDNTELLEVEE